MRIEIGAAPVPLATLRAAWLDRVTVELTRAFVCGLATGVSSSGGRTRAWSKSTPF